MMNKTTWISALALVISTAALGGCREPRAPLAAVPVAPVLADQAARLAPPPVASCATPAPADPAKTAPVARADKADTKTKRASSSAAKLEVKRLVFAEGIKNREPVAAKTSFSPDEARKIYAFVEVENPGAEESEVTVSFEPPGGGAAKGLVTLDVGPSRRWRTWAFTRGATTAGSWTAVVRGPQGEELARAPFEVTQGADWP